MPIFLPPAPDFPVHCPKCGWRGPLTKADCRSDAGAKCPECQEFVEQP